MASIVLCNTGLGGTVAAHTPGMGCVSVIGFVLSQAHLPPTSRMVVMTQNFSSSETLRFFILHISRHLYKLPTSMCQYVLHDLLYLSRQICTPMTAGADFR